MNYAVVLLGLGILAKYAYENVPDEVFVRLGKPLKIAFFMCLVGAISCGAVTSVLNLAQPVAADSKSSAGGEVEILSKQIATLQVKVESMEKSLQNLQESIGEPTITTKSKDSTKKKDSFKEKETDAKASSTSKNDSGDTEVSKCAGASVVTANVYLRARASTSSHVLTLIPRGTSIHVLNTTGDWNKVRYGNFKGYVAKRYCSK